MADALGETLCQRYERLKGRKDLYGDLMQECADYILPRVNTITTQGTEGENRNTKVYDSTAIHANELLAARIHGSMMSPAVKWFHPATMDDDLNEEREVAQWLEQAEQQMRLHLNLSNFHAQSHEVCLEAPALGTSALFGEERLPDTRAFEGLNFKAFSVAELVLDEDADGQVDTLMRVIGMTARAAAAKWPKGKRGVSGLSDETYQLAQDRPESPVEILHAIYKRSQWQAARVTPDGRMLPVAKAKLPWASCYVERKTKKLVEETGYHEQPFGVIRWALSPGEVYGRGPGMSALPDVRSLNRSVELFLEQWALAIRPPIAVRRRSALGEFRYLPGARNVMADPQNDVKEFITQARFDVTMAGIENLRKSVRDMFFSAQLELKQSPEMTATEVAARMQLMSQFLGPTSGRYMAELLTPILMRVFGILLRANKFPPRPPLLVDYFRQNGELQIKYLTPMARQQRNPELAAIERYTQMLLAVQQLHPAGMDKVDFDRALDVTAEVMGVPPSILRTERELREVRAAKVQAQQEAAQLSAMGAVAEAAGNAAPMVKALQPQNGGGL